MVLAEVFATIAGVTAAFPISVYAVQALRRRVKAPMREREEIEDQIAGAAPEVPYV